MSKALIEKAFEKFMLDKFGIEAKNIDIKAWNIYKDNFDYAWNKGATWQREQLEAEILNKEKSWYAEFPDEKSAQEVFNIIKELQTENKTIREQLEAEIKELERACSVANDEAGVLLEECRRHSKEIDTLQSKLDEAVEIIKTISKNANHYDKIDLQNKAEQFLSSLDKPKEEL